MEFLRQLTFENDKWTKNFNSFETVDDILDADENIEINDVTSSELVKEKKKKKKTIEKRTKNSICEKSLEKKIKKNVSNEKHVPIVLIKRFAS